ncbi:MAG: hypothetical protein LBH21_05145 [Gracilibacteraceae bacterium]|jgi:hypothetical protein|nr:hypothetical protein [Gracilibacteraceae bacterium]
MSGAIPGMITKTLLCVDGASPADISGRFYNLYLEKPVYFQTMKEFLDKMGEFLDTISFPQKFLDYRSFREENKETPARNVAPAPKKYWSEVLFEAEKGEQATFIFQVRFRQRGEWQGTLSWTERKKQRPFRSTLEFMRLLNAALNNGEGGGSGSGWNGAPAEEEE